MTYTALLMPKSLRIYLLLTAAVTGAAVLIVEILGAKMLAPYLGTSHFVWTAQISVTLLSLAAGYWLGGRLADRSVQLAGLYLCIAGAAVSLSATVLVTERVAYMAFRFSLPVAAVICSAALFLVPLTLLATVVPFLVRMLTTAVEEVGGVVGRLSSVSTLGSVLGTVLISYVFVPLLPNSTTMSLLAASLGLIAVGYFAAWHRRLSLLSATALALLAGCCLSAVGVRAEEGRHLRGSDELFRKNTPFGELRVWQNRSSGVRFYATDLIVQNEYDPKRRQSIDPFTYALHALPRLYGAHPRNVLCIGLGIGSVPMLYENDGAHVDVMEINPIVPQVARAFFGFAPRDMNILIGDGRQLLSRSTSMYDVILLDAFVGESSPFHLITSEVFELIRAHLQPGGLLVINNFGDPKDGGGYLVAALHTTLRSVFRDVRIHHSGGASVFIVASAEAELIAAGKPTLDDVHPHALPVVVHALEHTISPAGGALLTDDFNPADYFDAGNQEYIRRVTAVALRRR